MDETYLVLTFDIVGEADPQRAKVRPDMFVNDLIKEIQREFDIKEGDEYLLYRTGEAQPLDPKRTLREQVVQDGDQLKFTRPTLLQRKPINAQQKAHLRFEEKTTVTYDIQWQPALIGRPNSNATHTSLLAVNLEWLGKRSKRVSRRHAQIVERDGTYFIESLAPNNPTFVNKRVLVPGELRSLAHEDMIWLQASGVQLQFLLTEASTTTLLDHE